MATSVLQDCEFSLKSRLRFALKFYLAESNRLSSSQRAVDQASVI
jgi:hypothetical protein